MRWWGGTVPDPGFQEVKVVLCSADGVERQAWLVDVETKSTREQLLTDLVQVLKIEGEPADYELRLEPPLDRPVIFLTLKPRLAAQNVRPLGQANG